MPVPRERAKLVLLFFSSYGPMTGERVIRIQ